MRWRERKIDADVCVEKKLFSFSVVFILFLTSFTAFIVFVPSTAKAVAIVSLLPNAEGTTQQWNKSLGGDGNHYTKVTSNDADTSYVYASAINKIEQFNHADADLVGKHIKSVTVYATMKEVTDDVTVSMELYIDGSAYVGSTKSLTTSYATYSHTWTLNPADNEEWEDSDLDSLQTRFKTISVGSGAQARITYVYVSVLYENNAAPTNDGIVGVNPWDDTDNCYAQKKYYSLQTQHTDTNGYADFDYIELKIGQNIGEDHGVIYITLKYDEDDNIFTAVEGAGGWDFDDTGSSASRNGNSIIVTWKIKPQWDAVEESDVDFAINCYDYHAASDSDIYSNQFDTVTTLLTGSLTTKSGGKTDSRVNVGSSIDVDYQIYYANNPGSTTASSSYPPDTEFEGGAVYVYEVAVDGKPNGVAVPLGNSTNTKNGAGKVSFNAESAVANYTYRIYLDLKDKDYTDGYLTNLDCYLVADRIEIYSQTTDAGDGRVDVGTTVRYTVSARLDYDHHPVEIGDSLTSSDGVMTFSGRSWYRDYSTSSVGPHTFSVSSGSEATYGISSIYDSAADPTVIWDRIAINWDSEHKTMNARESNEISLSSVVLDYDDTPIEAYQYDVRYSLNGVDKGLLKDDASESSFNFEPKLAGNYSLTIDSFSGDNDYGITSYQANQTINISVKQRFQLNRAINNGIDYITWSGANISASQLAEDLGLTNDTNLMDSIAVYNASNGSWQTWYVGGGSNDFTIHTYDVIMTQLEKSNTIDISLSPGDYQTSKNVDLVDNVKNKGLNYFGWGNARDISMSTLAGAGYLNLPVGYAVYRWNTTTSNWDTYIKGITESFDVTTYDVIVTYVDGEKNNIPIT